LLAIVRAICCADPENVLGGGAVETVLTLRTQRRPERRLRLLRPAPRVRRLGPLRRAGATTVTPRA
jgi:hypothetical protein